MLTATQHRVQDWTYSTIGIGTLPTEAHLPHRNVTWAEGIAVIGQLYSAVEDPGETFATIELPSGCAADIIASRGQWLASNVWGSYLVAAMDARVGALWLFRDPTGLETLYYARLNTGLVFCSDFQRLLNVLHPRPSIAANVLARFLESGTRTSRLTAFQGITELEPGCALELSLRTERQHLFWNPVDQGAQSLPTREDPSPLIRKRFLKVIATRLADSSGAVIELSGGLDSSALLAAAAEASGFATQPIVGFTIHHPALRAATELDYARTIAATRDIPLVEADARDCLGIEVGTETGLPCPAVSLLHSPRHRLIQRIAADHGCDTCLSGHGGDQVFQAASEQPYQLADHLWSFHLRQLLLEVQAIPSRPYWSSVAFAARTAARHLAGRFDAGREPTERPNWFTGELCTLADSARTVPLFWPQLRKVGPFKSGQLLETFDCAAQVRRDPSARTPGLRYPYLEQPLVEAAFRLATKDLISGTTDRRAFRRAMQGLLPDSIIRRTSKGEYSGMYQLFLKENLPRLEGLILEGWLVRHRLLEATSLRADLRTTAQGGTAFLWPILHVIATELWLRGWGIG